MPHPGLTETDFLKAVTGLADMLGYRVMHISDSRRQVKRGDEYFTIGDESSKGWPDLTIVGHGRVLFRELKRDSEGPSKAQRAWLEALEEAGADVGIWRPRDWPEIERELKVKQERRQ